MVEVRKLDIEVKKVRAMERMHHPKADVKRLYLPGSTGGRGLAQLEMIFKTSMTGLCTYLKNTNGELLKVLYLHKKKRKLIYI